MLTADHTRIVNQLREGHAAMNAAGLGSPALDDFNKTVIRIVSESADPAAALRSMVDLLEEDMAARAAKVASR
jgi:hypothetical protein